MSEPITINLSSSALGKSGCILNLHRTVIEGHKEKLMPARMVYGIGVHKFIQMMYATNGHIPSAREEAIRVFNAIPKLDDRKSMHLSDANHMHAVALWTWEMCVVRDNDFEILALDQECKFCKGVGCAGNEADEPIVKPLVCDHCKGAGHYVQPACEITYSIPYYKDEYINVNWCGTLDRLGKIKNGIFVIPDWKTTSSWSEKEYFTQFELARAPRGYILALNLMSELYPESTLGKIGAGLVGARFDGIFVKPNINDVKFAHSQVFKFDKNSKEMLEFRMLLDDKCKEISQAVKTGYLPKQGIINGSCEGKWGKCSFWNICQQPDIVGEILLKRDFDKKPFNPLSYND